MQHLVDLNVDLPQISHLKREPHMKNCPDSLDRCGRTYSYCGWHLLVAQIKRGLQKKELFVSPSISLLSEFTLLLLLLIPSLISDVPASWNGLRTNISPGTFQVFHTRLGLLRHPSLWTKQKLSCQPLQ